MPVIDVNIEDFRELLGKDIEIEELMDRLPMMGTSWEGETDEGFAIEVFPNRPDLLSIEGLARAYASWTGIQTGLRDYVVHKSDYKVIVDQKTQDVRPYFVTAVIKNVEFEGAEKISPWRLRWELKKTRESHLFSALTGGSTFTEDKP